jgi:hypothetical protein
MQRRTCVHKQIRKQIMSHSLSVSDQEYLQTNGDGKSGVHLSAILWFDLILPLVVCSHILQVVVPITTMLLSWLKDIKSSF